MLCLHVHLYNHCVLDLARGERSSAAGQLRRGVAAAGEGGAGGADAGGDEAEGLQESDLAKLANSFVDDADLTLKAEAAVPV